MSSVNTSLKQLEHLSDHFDPLNRQRRIILFCDSVYQIGPDSLKHELLSSEQSWGNSRMITYMNGLIYGVSIDTGKIFAFNPRDQTHFTVSNDNWKHCHGIAGLDNHLYLFDCDLIWRIDPLIGKDDKVSKGNSWILKHPHSICAFRGKIYLYDGKGHLISWNPLDDSTEIVSAENWLVWDGSTSLVVYNDRLFVFTLNVYEVNVIDGTVTKISIESDASSLNSISAHENLIYYVSIPDIKTYIVKGELHSFDPSDGTRKLIDKGTEWTSCHGIY